MIGNDIVDLSVAEEQSYLLRRGYFDKIYSNYEQEIIKSSDNPVLQHWLLWTMKESAYKAHQRRFELPRSFNPRQMQCSVNLQNEAFASGVIEIQGYKYNSAISITKDFIYCTATILQQKEISSKIYPASEDIKKKLLKTISAKRKSAVQLFDLQKNDHGIPFFTYENEMLKIPFSLSHHGKFSAFTMALMNY